MDQTAVSAGLFCSHVPDSEASVTVWMLIFSISVIRTIFSLGFQVYPAFFEEENLKLIIALTLQVA